MERYFNNSLSCQPDFASATKNLLSLLKTQKITTFQQKTGGNTLDLVLKRMLEHVLKIQPLKEILEFQDWKRGYQIYTKKKFKPEIKPIIKNLQDELYQLENKQAKGAKFVLPSDGSLRAKNAPKLFSEYLKERICKIKQDLNLYWW